MSRAGVKELWLVDPASRSIQVFLLKDGTLQPFEVYTATDIAKVDILEGSFIETGKAFAGL